MPPIEVLVVGVIGEDSGKTVLSTSITGVARSIGIRAAVFKPYAATSVWVHPEILGEVRRRRLVVSSDSIRYLAVAPEVHPEISNPVAILLGPRDPSANMWRPLPLPSSETVELGVLGRVSMCRDERVDTLHFVNMDALSRLPQTVQDVLVDAAAALKPHPLRSGRSLVESIVSGSHDRAPLSCYERLRAEYELLVIESNSDVPIPLGGIRPSIVVVAGPGVMGIVNGARYMRSLEVLGLAGARGLSGARVEDVIRLSGVQETVPLPFLEDSDELYRREDLAPLIEKIVTLLAR